MDERDLVILSNFLSLNNPHRTKYIPAKWLDAMFTGGSKYSVYIILKTCQSLNIFCTSFLSLCCGGLFLALHIYWQAVLTPGVSALFASPDQPALAKMLVGEHPNPFDCCVAAGGNIQKKQQHASLFIEVMRCCFRKSIIAFYLSSDPFSWLRSFGIRMVRVNKLFPVPMIILPPYFSTI